MTEIDFDIWLSNYLGEDQIQVKYLLADKTAVRFLIAWSLLETSCFHGFAVARELKSHCCRIANDEGFDLSTLDLILNKFHARYQDHRLYNNLMHKSIHPDIKPLLDRCPDSLSNAEKLFLLLSVVYRYRNNIFHGSKGVKSWLQFKDQIVQCTQIMQALITHARDLPARRLKHSQVSSTTTKSATQKKNGTYEHGLD
jgi:hypothetical protein